jgi:hypothetical protein
MHEGVVLGVAGCRRVEDVVAVLVLVEFLREPGMFLAGVVGGGADLRHGHQPSE